MNVNEFLKSVQAAYNQRWPQDSIDEILKNIEELPDYAPLYRSITKEPTRLFPYQIAERSHAFSGMKISKGRYCDRCFVGEKLLQLWPLFEALRANEPTKDVAALMHGGNILWYYCECQGSKPLTNFIESLPLPCLLKQERGQFRRVEKSEIIANDGTVFIALQRRPNVFISHSAAAPLLDTIAMYHKRFRVEAIATQHTPTLGTLAGQIPAEMRTR